MFDESIQGSLQGLMEEEEQVAASATVEAEEHTQELGTLQDLLHEFTETISVPAAQEPIDAGM